MKISKGSNSTIGPYRYPPKTIHATEFAAAILSDTNNSGSTNNSNNSIQYAQHILYTLQRFVYTIQSDRRSSGENADEQIDNIVNNVYDEDEGNSDDVIVDDDDDDDDDENSSMDHDDEEEDEMIPMKKRDNDNKGSTSPNAEDSIPIPLKKKVKKAHNTDESWKDDIASYNVPFVGTNIASFARPAVVGPTSTSVDSERLLSSSSSNLIHTYLKYSPNAIEIFHNEIIELPSLSTNSNEMNNQSTSSRNKRNIHTMLQLSSISSQRPNTSNSAPKPNKDVLIRNKKERYQRKLSYVIMKVTIQAMTEIVMVYVPQPPSRENVEGGQPSRLRLPHRNNKTQTQPPQFLVDMITQKVPILLQLLINDVKEYTSTTKPNLKDSIKNYKNDGLNHRGILITPILVFLTKCTQLSLSITKMILRSIDQTVPNSILRLLFTYHHCDMSTDFTTLINDPQYHVQQYRNRISSSSYYSVLNFVSIITEQMSAITNISHYDSTLFQNLCNTHISSTNNNKLDIDHLSLNIETKLQKQQSSQNKTFGVLYLALQFRGFTASSGSGGVSDDIITYDNIVYLAVIRLLQVTRQMIIAVYNPSTSPQTKHNYNQRILYELFTARISNSNNECCTQQFATLTTLFAPPIINYDDVIEMRDDYNHQDNVELIRDCSDINQSNKLQYIVGIEARRLLFLFLSDSIHSPILRSLSSNSITASSSRLESTSIQFIVRLLLHLLSSNDSEKKAPYSSKKEIQRFVVFVTKQTPIILPALLRIIHIDEVSPTTSRNMIAILSQINFISTLLLHGPRIIDCVRKDRASLYPELNEDSDIPSRVIDSNDYVVSTLLPFNLKKQKFLKLLANANDNSLVALEAYKLLVIILRRCRNYLNDHNNDITYTAINNINNQHLLYNFFDVLEETIPDLSQLVLGLSRLTSCNNMQKDYTKSNIFILTWACEAIQTYCSVLSHKVKGMIQNRSTTSIDVYKLLPTNINIFLSSPTLLQQSLLATVKALISLDESICSTTVQVHPSLFRALTKIAILTRSEKTYETTRSVAILALCHINGGKRDHESQHEASCWVDGLTMENLDDFCGLLLKDSNMKSASMKLELICAWRKANLPNPVPSSNQVSTILIRAVKVLKQASNALKVLIVQAVTRCLLSSANPIPLAVMVLEYVNADDGELASIQRLMEYTRALIYYDRYTAIERSTFVTNLLVATYTSGSYPMKWFSVSTQHPYISRNYFNINCCIVAQQLTHLVAVKEDGISKNSMKALLWKLLPLIIVGGLHNSMDLDHLHTIIAKANIKDDKVIDCMLLSCSKLVLPKSNKRTNDLFQAFSSSVKFELSTKSAHQRSAILFLYLIGSYLPDDAFFTILCYFLAQLREANEILRNFKRKLCAYFLQLSRKRMKSLKQDTALTARFAKEVLNAWMSVDTSNNCDILLQDLVSELELALVSILSVDHASLVLLAYDATSLIQRFVQLKKPVDCHYSDDSNVLYQIVSHDPLRFGPAIFQMICGMHTNKELSRLFYEGVLDKTLGIVLECDVATISNYNDNLLSFIGFLNIRISNVTVGEIEDIRFTDLLSVSLKVFALSHTLSDQLNTESLAEVMQQTIKRQCQEIVALKKDDPITMNDMYIEFSFFICTNSRLKSDSVRSFSSTLLMYLCAALLQSLRVHQVRNQKSSLNELDMAMKLLALLQKLLSNEPLFDISVLNENGIAFWKPLIKNCVLQGMKIETAEKELSVLCLQTIQSIVYSMQRGKSDLATMEPCSIEYISKQIFELVTSHSKFNALMTSNFCDTRKVEIARLLLTCISQTIDIEFDRYIWTTLLASYDASLDEKDTLIRCVLNEYHKVAKKSSLTLHAEQLRWGDAAFQESSSHSWNWLLDMIELRRIQATLDNFPIYDTIIPDSVFSLRKSRETINDAVQNLTGCPRYSPGFLLPLIACALYSEAVTVTRSSGTSQGQATRIAQLLQGRGALALTLACLSSKCSSMRKLSIAILGLFIKAVTSQDAHLSSAWKERPQIAMLLNSVQRSLVVRYCSCAENTSSVLIPELPGFSSIFLARASIVLAYPSDVLYIAINRALLRSEEDSGAFQDLTRLPVFVSLFCSSADHPDQLAAERKFALQLVKDGFTDPSTFKLLTQCHCPELILSAIDCSLVRTSFGHPDELQILFTTLTKIITVGAERAASHLVHRLGLVSWTRAFMLGNPCFTTTKARASFLIMVKELLKLAKLPDAFMDDDDFVASTTGIAQGVVAITVDPLDDGSRTIPTTFSSNSILENACDILHLLAAAQHSVDSGRSKEVHIRPDGVDIHLALQFVSKLQLYPEYKLRSVFAICVLPMKFDSGDGQVIQQLCNSLFDACEDLQRFTDAAKLAILRRINYMYRYGYSERRDWGNIHQYLMVWRRACLRSQELRQAWLENLKNLTDLEIKHKDNHASCIASIWSDWILQNENEFCVA